MTTPARDADALTLAKRVLRKAVQLRRDARSGAERRQHDLARLSLLRARLLAGEPRTVACYLSAGSEPGTLPLIAWLAAHERRILLPVLTDDDGRRRAQPAWAHYRGPDHLRAGWSGIVEPVGPSLPAEAIGEADAVLCPGVAATRSGLRLGRGGGWYDRVLPHRSAAAWVLLNDDEVLPQLPAAPWDCPVDAVVTPTRFLVAAESDDAEPGGERG